MGDGFKKMSADSNSWLNDRFLVQVSEEFFWKNPFQQRPLAAATKHLEFKSGKSMEIPRNRQKRSTVKLKWWWVMYHEHYASCRFFPALSLSLQPSAWSVTGHWYFGFLRFVSKRSLPCKLCAWRKIPPSLARAFVTLPCSMNFLEKVKPLGHLGIEGGPPWGPLKAWGQISHPGHFHVIPRTFLDHL